MMDINLLKIALTPSEEQYADLPIHIVSFSAYMIGHHADRLKTLLKKEFDQDDQQWRYDSIAMLGFSLGLGNDDPDLVKTFQAEAEHIGGRQYFIRDRAPIFELDGVALLGFAIGYSTLDCPPDKVKWLLDLLDEAASHTGDDSWNADLVNGARAVLRGEDFSTLANVELRMALSHRLKRPINESDLQEAWESAVKSADEPDFIKKVVRRAVYDCSLLTLASVAIKGAGLEELCSLLENITQSMSHWTFETKQRVKNSPIRQWHIDHEYHVQNLLWTILRPVFVDLVDEQSLPKVGHKSPKYDLGIPSLSAIIEVKFLKKTGQRACAKIIEEVAADASLYLKSGNGYDHLIAFIWDDCRQTEEYSKIISGLESISGIRKAIILPRPKRMQIET